MEKSRPTFWPTKYYFGYSGCLVEYGVHQDRNGKYYASKSDGTLVELKEGWNEVQSDNSDSATRYYIREGELLAGGIYEIDFNANVTSATPGSIALGIFTDGVKLNGGEANTVIAAAGDYENISIKKCIANCTVTYTFSFKLSNS